MAVVEGLQSFIGGMDKIQSAIEGIRPPASLLQDAFGLLTDAAGNFASFIGDTLTFALGGLFTDAIEGVISIMGNMITAAFDAGNAFQALRVRLEGINLNDPNMGLSGFSDGVQRAIDLTKEQIKWIKIMAVITPFTAEGIASVYTLQRAMGLTDDAAKKLVVSITNFAAGTALPESSVKRLSDAFAKMTSSGKVNGLLFRQLRSEYTPINAILDVVQQNLGLTTAQFEDMTKTGTIAPEEFIKAFEQVANQRFPDAAAALAHTWQGAVNNMQDVVANFGENITGPILDTLGTVAGSFVDAFATMTDGGPQLTALGQRLSDAVTSIGGSLSSIITSVLGLMPSTEDIASGLVGGLENVAKWLTDNKDLIVTKIQEIWQWFQDLGKSDLVTTIIPQLMGLWDQLTKVNEETGTTGWQDLLGALGDIGTAIGEVVNPVLELFGIHLGDNKPTIQGFVDALHGISDWIRDHKDLLQFLILVFIQLEIIQTISNLVIGFIAALIGLVAGVLAGVAVFGILLIVAGLVIAIIGAVILVFKLFQLVIIGLGTYMAFWVILMIGYFKNLRANLTQIWTDIANAIKNKDWGGIGWAIVSGIARGISLNVGLIISAAEGAAWAAYQAALAVLGIHSPSTIFAGVGENIMSGMAKGITASAGVAVAAMQGAVAAVSMPALSAPSLMQSYTQAAPSAISNTYQSSNSYNLSINSSASTEPIISDFNMLSSLAGA